MGKRKHSSTGMFLYLARVLLPWLVLLSEAVCRPASSSRIRFTLFTALASPYRSDERNCSPRTCLGVALASKERIMVSDRQAASAGSTDNGALLKLLIRLCYK